MAHAAQHGEATHGHVAPLSMYLAVFGALVIGTIVTVLVAYVDLGFFNTAVALGIAVTKATLVILFFMHAKYSSRLTKLFVGMSFFFLLILFSLTMTDYLSRGLKTYPGGAGGAGYNVKTPVVEHEAPAGEEHKQGAAAH